MNGRGEGALPLPASRIGNERKKGEGGDCSFDAFTESRLREKDHIPPDLSSSADIGTTPRRGKKKKRKKKEGEVPPREEEGKGK